MFITRSVVARQAGRSLGGVAFAALLAAVGVLLAAEAAEADPDSPPNVYHSPGDTGVDTRSEYPPGCLPAGEPEAPAAAAPSDPVELITNGGFENEDLSGWMSVGNVSVVGAGYGTGPIGGAFNALLENGFEKVGGSSLTGVTDAEIEAFFGLGAGDLDALQGVTEGSAIKQSFTASVGETISFDFVVLADDCNIIGCPGGVEDFAFVSILVDGVLEVFATTFGPLVAGSGSPYFAETGVFSFSHTLTTGGTVELGIAVLDGGDAVVPSAILVDNVSLLVVPPHIPPGLLDCVVKGGPGEELFLYIDGGDVETTSGTECSMAEGGEGNGYELCAADVLIDLSGFGAFTDFFMDTDPGMETLVWQRKLDRPAQRTPDPADPDELPQGSSDGYPGRLSSARKAGDEQHPGRGYGSRHDRAGVRHGGHRRQAAGAAGRRGRHRARGHGTARAGARARCNGPDHQRPRRARHAPTDAAEA